MPTNTQPIETLLVANRGEIACRVIKTARKLGIKTVAVYSEADIHGLHVRMADEAVAIGPAPSNESYLVIDRIVSAALNSGADAVHPGFGFLSENADFSTALDNAGVRFIGPANHAIKVMGDKIESKKLAQSAGVNTVPGYPDALVDAEQALSVARDIGCPVMLKASAGGGGKGMRVAWTLEDVVEGFNSAQNEARSAFGDDRVFLEKFIERPRHIEIQILADAHGNCVYLGERECSIQRRHQKVIEEAPSPFLDTATRQAMGEQAVMLAQAVNYQSAGTVEFIVDKDRNFYFLEMNTRLQVEHPVTEFITGLDLVEQMIRIAEGRPLDFQQSDIKLNGWSLEARVYAEDPDRNFMPSIGRLTHYSPPIESASVRVDTGVFEGGEISMYYDPMIAKLVTWGEDRTSALSAMQQALDSYVIRGVKHNIPFLSALIGHAEFKAGNLTTGFIDEHYPEGFDSQSNLANETPNETTRETLRIALSAWAQHQLKHQARSLPTDQSFQSSSTIGNQQEWVVVDGEQQHRVSIEDDGSVVVNGTSHTLSTAWAPGELLATGSFNQETFHAQLDRAENHWQVTMGGSVRSMLVVAPRVAKLLSLMPVKQAPDLSRFLLSPMPGLLIRTSVKVGESVKAGQELAVVEAMKMENVLSAEQDGVVKDIPFEAGSSLAVDDVIVEFE